MLNCQQSAELTSQTEQALPFTEHVALRLHRMLCTQCRRYANQINFIHQACEHLQEHAEKNDIKNDVTLSDASKKRIAKKLSDAQASK